MATIFRPRTLILFVGDLFFLAAALWLSLIVRNLEMPSNELFVAHLTPFSILFAVWVGVYFIAGLYESRSIILARRALSTTLLVAQTFNIAIAALFFFYIPLFGIAPKTILFIYLIISFLGILLWRAYLYPRLGLQRQEAAIVVGDRPEVVELVRALARAPFAPARVVEVIAPTSRSLSADVQRALAEYQARFIIADFGDQRVSGVFPEMYNLISLGVRFFDAMVVYEQVFGRIPLSLVDERWLARNVSRYSHRLYDPLKRTMDIVVAVVGGVLSLVLYPFIITAIKLDSSGPAIISMMRAGEGGRQFRFYKFRSMSGNDEGEYGRNGTTSLSVTRVGKVLRTTRLDELPQFWNVIKGDLSLIGPRPETPSLVALYEKEIPHYNMRHLIKPGISGWAQLYHDNHPHHSSDVEATREKLSYDFYYLKHRSLTLDAIIVLKTLKKLLVRSGA